jgi:O-methyltransferase involved in polyketide biosynthesis
MAARTSSPITPTAHYTGHVWLRHGLSHPAFRTRQGAAMFAALRPFNGLARLIGGASLETMLLARHRAIDALLGQAIDDGRVGQVVEIAAGLSPRGHRFAARHAERGLLYIESDLPAMAERKRRLLESAGLARDNLRVVVLDALAADGDASLRAVANARLDPARGTAIITEGLVSYLTRTATDRLWRQIARTLAAFPHGLYLSDLHLAEDFLRVPGARLLSSLLQTFTRTRREPFVDADQAVAALADAGFATSQLHRAGERSSAHVRVVEARTVIE